MTPEQLLDEIEGNIQNATTEEKISPEKLSSVLNGILNLSSPYNQLTVFITTPESSYLSEGPLEEGKKYYIDYIEDGDDFGTLPDNEIFVYNNEEIPTWTNGTLVLEVSEFEDQVTFHVAHNTTGAAAIWHLIIDSAELAIGIELQSIVPVLTNSIDISSTDDYGAPFRKRTDLGTIAFLKNAVANLTQFHTTFRIYPQHEVILINGGGGLG